MGDEDGNGMEHTCGQKKSWVHLARLGSDGVIWVIS
jgi:hypothetical protein